MTLASLRCDRDLRDTAADLGRAVDEIDEVVRKNEEKLHGSDLHALATRQDQHGHDPWVLNTTPLENSREVPPRRHDEVLRLRAARFASDHAEGFTDAEACSCWEAEARLSRGRRNPHATASTTPSYSARISWSAHRAGLDAEYYAVAGAMWRASLLRQT